MVTLNRIYTRSGDAGDTALGNGVRVPKYSARVTAYGTIDEVNSAIGLVLASDLPQAVRDCLTRIQHELFDLGGELSEAEIEAESLKKSIKKNCNLPPGLVDKIISEL